ncbi:pilin [Patescibacteria group bacterium]|nr:pilin [Patescibacteria group bacterium]
MKQFLSNIIAWQKAYAQDLIPCADGSYADPGIGCVEAPGGLVSSEVSVVELVLKIASVLMTIVAAAAVIMLIVAGIMYALSAGDEEKMQKAKRIILWSVIGLIVALIAHFIAQGVIGLAG